jgi:hypothetical protein
MISLKEKNHPCPNKETFMTSIVDSSVSIHTSAESAPCPSPCFGEVVLLITHLKKQGVLAKLRERVQFARRRFGRYEALSPWAEPFMALFGRDQLPARSTLSRFLAALPSEPVEALRTLFLDDLLSRPLVKDANEKPTGGLVDRMGNMWVVIDLDGTREAARQRALPQTNDLPPSFRRLDEVCAPGYTGRKRGQVVRTRTTLSQAHTFHWLGSFGNRGNGQYREELRKGLAVIHRYLAAHHLSQERTRLAS